MTSDGFVVSFAVYAGWCAVSGRIISGWPVSRHLREALAGTDVETDLTPGETATVEADGFQVVNCIWAATQGSGRGGSGHA
ncbi:hypothetical protein J2M53_10860 [Arthrobacter sp. zg-ZUI100]|uniref:hypothetical protein n=1 Tax=Arthrobacter jiangjiafuii TaxID=2817475 RepID=UPI001AEE4D8F|nr:hypothetical protein [Arthrobacter jiangjiafuii]MBP3036743.1 hypothetical protein [Arthrobacter jiangjiafuii]